MPKSLRVKSKFEATENISATARKIEKNTRRLNKSMKRGFRESTRSALNFKGVLKGILAAGAISKGFGLLSQGVRSVTTDFISFDDAITAAAVRFKDIGPEAKNFEAQMKGIEKSARQAGQTTIFTATQAASALDFLARAGFTSTEAMGSLNSMINLSIASGEDFAQVADFSSDLLGSFGLAVNDSAQKIANLNRLNDVLVKTVNSANVRVEDLFETMKQVGPVAAGVLGSSLEEVSAMAAILGNSGIKSSTAMTALKNIFLRIAAPAREGETVLKALGLTLDDGTGKAKGMTQFMQEMGQALKGFNQIEQAKILDTIFGKRAIAGAKIIFDNIQNIKDFKTGLDDAGGTAQKTAAIMQTSLGNRIKGLGSALTELGFKVLDPFETKIKSSIESLTQFFRTANPQPLVDAFTAVAEAAGFVFDLLGKLKTTTKAGERGTATEAFDRFIESFTKPGGPSPFADQAKFLSGLLPSLFEGETIKKENQAILNAVKRFFTPGPGAEEGLRRHFANPFADIQPEFAAPAQPNLNVNIENQINAKDVDVETTVTAPGTSGGKGKNKF